MEKILESTTKVRFQDCDPFNHLNNSKYIDYFVNAREDQILKHYKLDVFAQIHTLGKSWVVGAHQIAYIKPVSLNEEVIIISQLIEFSGGSLRVEMQMFDKTKTVLKSILWTTFAYFDIINKTKALHSNELNSLFKEILNPIENQSFEKRCNQIIMNIKSK
jgi:acyl-CoA thioester hydrolase